MNVVPASRPPSGKYLPVVVVSQILLVFGLGIYLVSQQLRHKVREQMAGREGEILREIVRMQMAADAAEADLAEPIDDPANQVTLVLETSRLPRLKNVMAIRLFDAAGKIHHGFLPFVGAPGLN